MTPLIIFLVVVAGLVLRGMTAEERVLLARRVFAWLLFAKDAITKPAGSDSFNMALRARTRWAVVTPAIVVLYVVVFALMVLSPGTISDPQTLVAWGGSIGPRTTNGEWWRLLASMFVHTSVLHLLAEIAGLLQVGLLVERLVGRLAFAAVFLAAGLLASVWALTVQPVVLHVGAAGATFGVYGLLVAALVWGFAQRSTLAVPLPVLKGLSPGVLLFAGYHALTEGLVSNAMSAGLIVGLAGGIVVTARVVSDKPPARRVYAALAATVVIVIALAAPLRGLADVTGEIARVHEIEARTSRSYDEAVERFKDGRLKAADLAALAERIVPELQSAQARIDALDNVPGEHQAMVADASQYLRLRQDSWRLRAEGLRATKPAMLQKADVAAHSAMSALDRTASLSRP